MKRFLQVCFAAFPHVVLELSETEAGDYFKPSDLMIGKTVNIYGRNFLIYDCDMFTKSFYTKNFWCDQLRTDFNSNSTT